MNYDLKEELQKYFGFNGFKPGQEKVIAAILNRDSAGAIFPTGAGKSLCYQLPAMLLPHLTLVVSPLLSLMKDQMDFLHSHKIPAARVDSTLSSEEYNRIITQGLSGDLKILMISVERFKNERFRIQLKKMKISLMVIDEAHCISEWGHNFRPEYLRLPDYQREFQIPQVLLLTATATSAVSKDMQEKFFINDENLISTGFYRPNLQIKVIAVKEREKENQLLKDLQNNEQNPSVIYVTLQKTAEETASFLKSNGINAEAYHAGMKNEDRTEIQNRFMSGSLNCVVATIAFGMGVNKKDIRKIIHYDLPKSIENYSQEIGRSGRDGNKSECIVYGNKGRLPVLENFVYGDTPDADSINKVLSEISHSGQKWEVKLSALSREANIRLLPLKTLLVYLSIRNIIKPLYTYFEEYSFKYLKEPSFITAQFNGERKEFVRVVLENCLRKKVWTTVDFNNLSTKGLTDRKRIISALDYFDQQGWIELEAKQAVEVYEVLQKGLNCDLLSGDLHSLFMEKEKTEIQRIHKMLNFFENDSCLSVKLAAYFGQILDFDRCGHCSCCLNGPVSMPDDSPQKQSGYDVAPEEIRNIQKKLKPDGSAQNITKFLCGIKMPLFGRLKLYNESNFGRLQKHAYRDVYLHVNESL